MINILEKFLAFINFLIEYIKFLYKIYKLKVYSPDQCYPIIGHAYRVIGLSEEGDSNKNTDCVAKKFGFYFRSPHCN